MTETYDRREFLQHVAGCAAAGVCLCDAAAAEKELPKVPDHSLTVIAGKPRERGKLYGQKFKTDIQGFLDREIYQRFIGKPSPREEMLRYAGQCLRAIK